MIEIKKNSEYYSFIDVGKCIASFLIVLMHVITPVHLEIFKIVQTGCIAYFFFASGYLFKENNNQKSIFKFVPKCILKMLIPYIVFAAIGYYLGLVFPDWYEGKTSVDIFNAIFIVGQPLIFGHIWFLISLLEVTIVFYLLWRIISCEKKIVQLIIFLIILFSLYNLILYYEPLEKWPFKLSTSLMGLVFFIIGFLFKKFNIDKLFNHIVVDIIVFILFRYIIYLIEMKYMGYTNMCDCYYYDLNIYLLIEMMAIISFICIGKLLEKVKLFEFCGKINLYIYLLHMPVMWMVLQVYYQNINLEIENLFDMVIVAIVTYVLTAFVSYLIFKYIYNIKILYKNYLENYKITKNIWSIELEKLLTYMLVSIIFICSILLLFNGTMMYGVDCPIGYDTALNGSVGYNFITDLKYEISSPKKIIFYPYINAGEPIILLTSLVYKMFGVSHLNTLWIQTIIAILIIYFSYKILSKYGYNIQIIVFVVMMLLLSSSFYNIYINLYGEVGAIFFIVLTLYLLRYDKNKWFSFLAGVSLGLSYKCKTIMIYFVIAFLVVLLFDSLLLKKFKLKNYLYVFSGVIFVLLSFFIFRIWQCGGLNEAFSNLTEYIIISNKILNGSGLKGNIVERFLDINNIICEFYIFYPILLVILPIVSYILVIFVKKIRNIVDVNDMLMIEMGVASSFIYYIYVFIGTEAYNTTRLYSFFVSLQLFLIYLIIYVLKCINEIFENKFQKIKFSYITNVLLIIILFAYFFWSNFENLYSRYVKLDFNKSYDYQLEEDYIQNILKIPKDNVLVTYVKSTPQVDLYVHRNIIDLSEVDISTLKDKQVYLLVGNVWDKSWDFNDMANTYNFEYSRLFPKEIDYSKFYSEHRNDSIDLYSIYKLDFK